MRIIDDADQRRFLGHVGQQAEHREPDQEAIRSFSRAQPERGTERVALRPGKAIDSVEERRAELMQSGERELHLRLDARRPCDATSGRARHDVLEQRGLADSRFPTQNEHLALPGPRTRNETIQRLALGASTAQRRLSLTARRGHTRRLDLHVLKRLGALVDSCTRECPPRELKDTSIPTRR